MNFIIFVEHWGVSSLGIHESSDGSHFSLKHLSILFNLWLKVIMQIQMSVF